MTGADRPVLTPRGEEQVFYDRLRKHELVYQRCERCDDVVFPLRTICPGCGGERLVVEQSTGRGVIYSHTTQYRAAHPFFADEVPYTLALVDLDEGFRVFGSVPEPEGLRVGVPIEVHFEDVDDDLTLMRFHRAETTHDQGTQ